MGQPAPAVLALAGAFATGWIAEQGCQRLPVVFYGGVLLGAALAYYILVRALFALEGPKSALAVALGSDFKGRISVLIYVAAIGLAWVQPLASYGCYVAVALMWLGAGPAHRTSIRQGAGPVGA